MFATCGIITTTTCNSIPNKNAPIRYLFSKIPCYEDGFSTFYIKAVDKF